MIDHDEVTITLTLDAEWELKVSEVWPDGPPDEITADAVTEAFKRHRRVTGLLQDWALEDDLLIEVDVFAPNPEYKQAEALFPELAASPTIHSKAWWAGV